MMLDSTSLLSYHVHAHLLNVLIKRNELLQYTGHILTGVLRECFRDVLLDSEGCNEDEEMNVYKMIYYIAVPLEYFVCIRAKAMGNER